jgi:hypothetical protein
MAQVGTIRDVATITSLEKLTPLSYGDFCTPFEMTLPNCISSVMSQRFPVPSIAWGFLAAVENSSVFPQWAFTRGPPYFLGSALTPEASYLEPKIGQIWPR